MTDIVNDLRTALAERQKVMKGGGELYRRASDEIERLRDVNDQSTAALEAAERRAEEAERELQVAEDQANNLAGDLAQAEKRWEQRVRIAEQRAEAWKRLCESTETATTEVIEERDQLAAAVESAVATGDQAWGTGNFDWYDLRDILAVPADALRDLKSDVWDEGFKAGWAEKEDPGAFVNDVWDAKTPNPYREEER